MPRKKTSDKSLSVVKSIINRDGQVIPFDLEKIKEAILKAFQVTGEGDDKKASELAKKVLKSLIKFQKRLKIKGFISTVEMIQDLVERALIAENLAETAKSYILYRNKRKEFRKEYGPVPEHVRKLSDESKKYFRNPLGEFVYYRTYSRWIDGENRRETWIETVDRYVSFMKENMGDKLKDAEYAEIREYILNQKSMPSMRLMQFSGPAARKTNVCAYNCSFIAPSKLEDFAEIMYISMCGTGVGFSVESQNVESLPQIKIQMDRKLPVHVVEDSKEGWCDALTLGVKAWFNGDDIIFDYSKIRSSGARLKTFGGKASGPEPLKQLMDFARGKIMKKQGRRLSTIDVHDIICKIGEIVVAGGVRRSALISLSDLDDKVMRDAKKGQFWISEGQRMLANNSAVYNSKPPTVEFMSEWLALMKSNSGERGIFNRGGLLKTLPERRIESLKNADYILRDQIVKPIGTNPCGEIILRSKQFCNLSEVIARAEDTEETLMQKIRIATILGTYQSTLTKFEYLSKDWKQNCEEERLLGVSITGQWDCKTVRNPEILRKLKEETIRINKAYAKRFGINESTCITCVKPSGTVSQAFDCASGMHPRFAPYYIRRIRISATDALFTMLKDQGVPYYPEVGQLNENVTTYVMEFPVKAPSGAVCNDDLTAIDQLMHWKMVKENYTEHNPSVTIYVGDDEWIDVANWIHKNWEIVGGLSFLPRSNHVYQLAPYEPITKEKYDEMFKKIGHIDFAKIVTYEIEDETEVKKELACVAGLCEV
ncbi:ribonucleoside-triphosphate reductase [Candidatus Nomurabacteria bacterium RIFCSPLOWO2_01_FULL_42_20]|nr:MAG: ribonucleoside-triphosphate reductase [Candidatus Nomurabacteria bacterium RIFCSPLOWO2_01_FULL_42_20]